MKKMLLPTGAVIGGLVVAFILISLSQMLSGKLYPFPEGLDPFNPAHKDQFQAFLDAAPLSMFLIVLVGYMLASFAGGWVASLISKEHSPKPALILGGLLTVAGIMNLSAIAHPIWFAVINIPSFLIFAWLGSLVSTKKQA